MLQDDELKDWLDKNAVMIGSRAFGVESEGSDYDYAVLESTFDTLDPNHKLNARNYVKVFPVDERGVMKNSSIFKSSMSINDEVTSVDILIYEDQEDLDRINSVVELMKTIPKLLIESKTERVRVFETLLEDQGFKRV